MDRRGRHTGQPEQALDVLRGPGQILGTVVDGLFTIHVAARFGIAEAVIQGVCQGISGRGQIPPDNALAFPAPVHRGNIATVFGKRTREHLRDNRFPAFRVV